MASAEQDTKYLIEQAKRSWSVEPHSITGDMHSAIQPMVQAAEELLSEIKLVTEHLRLEASHDIRPVYCIGSDIVEAALFWRQPASSENLFSCLLLEDTERQNLLMPSTIYSLLQYPYIVKALNVNPTDLSLLSVVDLKSWSSSITTDKVNNILQFVVESLHTGNFDSLLTFDAEITKRFRTGLIDPLSHKIAPIRPKIATRVSGVIAELYDNKHSHQGNMDALNFSIIHEMNKDVGSHRTKYILVHDKNQDARVYREICLRLGIERLQTYFPQQSFVFTPRVAFLHKALRSAGAGSAGGERVGHDLIQKVLQYILALEELPVLHATQGELERLSAVKPSSDLIAALSALDFLQDMINNIKRNHGNPSSNFMERGSAFELYRSISDLTNSALNSELRDNFSLGGAPNISLSRHKTPKNANYLCHHSLMFDGFLAATIKRYSDYTAFSISAGASISEFISALNGVLDIMKERVIAGSYLRHVVFESPDVFAGVGSSRVRRVEGVIDNDISLKALCSALSCKPADIRFLRLDFPLFTASFEPEGVGIFTQYYLKDEVASFLEDLFDPRFKGSAGVDRIHRYFYSRSSHFINQREIRQEGCGVQNYDRGV